MKVSPVTMTAVPLLLLEPQTGFGVSIIATPAGRIGSPLRRMVRRSRIHGMEQQG